jgi:hypothetical protein
MTTDLTKPVQTACGYPARVLVTDGPGRWPVWAAYEYTPGDWVPVRLNADGSHQHEPGLSLVNVPEPEPLMVTIRMTPEDAARIANCNPRFRALTGTESGCVSHAGLLTHFTALAKQQQRGEAQ